MLLRLTYLGVTNALALLRLMPMSDRDKDTEILVLRHQIAVLQRQLGAQKPRFGPNDQPPRHCACRISRPCSSSGMLVFVEDTAESVSAAYVQVGDPSLIRDRCGDSS